LHTREIGKNLFQVELETGGFKNLICSYVIKTSKITLVESGPTSSVPNLISGLKELDIRFEDVEYLAITHVHLDHGGGAGTLLKILPNAKVLVNPRGMPHLIDPELLWVSAQTILGFISEIFGEPEPVSKERIIPVTEGTFDLGKGAKLKAVETIGHASHNLSFQESFNNGIFPGDAAGTYFPEFEAVIPTTPPPFHLEKALASLDKLIDFEPTFLYFSHFGKATNAVERLRSYKIQLELWARIAEEGVKKNHSLGQIRDGIIAEDNVLSQVEIASFIRSHRIYSKTVLENSVKGFIEYAKQKKAS
jgi:glyoxylase-like metal-dependent hydrolase (beta-lactamase superfamily II)